MLAYKPDLDPTFFTTHFIDGLHTDLRATILIQRPYDLDIVVSLALLREEIGNDDDRVFPPQKSMGFSASTIKRRLLLLPKLLTLEPNQGCKVQIAEVLKVHELRPVHKSWLH
jgi:hypothetical protein